ncbi:hydrogenase maturation protease [Vibrio sp. vnigr-6D03]|uniref:hydrogenase maturation protease n=1 Tax=Vibrio sp. vnigr-6D03 TaxID=2058088 RepID=UPI0015E11FD8|nr:hydrogenase maturation protease [Vibrio sp. vnigr-6D03]
MLHVLCFGNRLHGDDGVGPMVASHLLDENLPTQMKVFDCGVAGLNALPFFSGCSYVLMIDAYDLGEAAGSWRYLDVDEVINLDNQVEDHNGGLSYLLNAVKALVEPCPELALIGVQIESVRSFHPELSSPVENAIDTVKKEVLRVVQCRSHAVSAHE